MAKLCICSSDIVGAEVRAVEHFYFRFDFLIFSYNPQSMFKANAM